MLDEKPILSALSERNIRLAYPLLQDHSEQARVIAFVDVHYDSDGIRRPSERYIYDIKNDFLAKGVYIDFVAVSARLSSLEEELRFVLINNVGRLVRNSFLSLDQKNANIWIVAKHNLSPAERGEVHALARDFLRQKGINLSGFEFSNEVNLITKTGCIAIIRSFAPMSQDKIRFEIEKRNFVVPSDNWLSRMLDNIRKSSFIMRKGNGDYVLTLAGLRASGTVKTSRSPDVRRMLELGKRSR